MTRTRLVAKMLLVLMLFTNTSFGWSAGGHRVIARIAWAELNESERQTIANLIRENPRFDADFDIPDGLSSDTEVEWLFTQAAVWPDIIRSRPQFHRSIWHYINLPIYLTNDDQDVLEEELPANLLTEVPSEPENVRLNAIQCVKFSLDDVLDPDADDEAKGAYICWLFHVVGDLHQPLHSSAMFTRSAFPNGDRGGNLIRTNSGNVHSFWDKLLGRNIVFNTVKLRAVDILTNDELAQLSEDALEDLNPEVWADEDNEICEDFVYSDAIREAIKEFDERTTDVIAFVELPGECKTEAGAIARQRPALAGFRMTRFR